MTIVIAILVFGFIIFFHELGHFIVAKRCGVKVNEFCLGFGPRLIGIKRGETDYCLRLLPLGGACVMEGEEEDTDDERSFLKRPIWQRALIIAAGPLFNFLLAFILAAIMIGTMGISEPVISHVTEDFPAEEAGLKEGDRIISLNNYDVHFYKEVTAFNFFNKDKPVEVTYLRDGQKYTTTIIPKYSEEDQRYILGVTGPEKRKKLNFIETIGNAFYELRYQITVTFKSLGMLVTGQVGIKDMSGPVGIVKVIGDTVKDSMPDGALYVVMNLFNITVLLSANLGVMNLIPIPALDGGRLLFILIEAISRKKVPRKVEAIVNGAGFIALMALMVVVMISDVVKVATGQL